MNKNMSESGVLTAVYKGVRNPTQLDTLPETNIFAPENGWLEY